MPDNGADESPRRDTVLISRCRFYSWHAAAQKNKKKTEEPVTQTLPVLKDPPGAVAAETARLVFHVSPLSNKGLLSQQIRDALKALLRDYARRGHRETARLCRRIGRYAARDDHRERNIYRS